MAVPDQLHVLCWVTLAADWGDCITFRRFARWMPLNFSLNNDDCRRKAGYKLRAARFAIITLDPRSSEFRKRLNGDDFHLLQSTL